MNTINQSNYSVHIYQISRTDLDGNNEVEFYVDDMGFEAANRLFDDYKKSSKAITLYSSYIELSGRIVPDSIMRKAGTDIGAPGTGYQEFDWRDEMCTGYKCSQCDKRFKCNPRWVRTQ